MAPFSKGIMKSENLVFVTHRSTEQNYKHVANRYFIIRAHHRNIKKPTPPSNGASDSGRVAFFYSQALLLIHLQMGRHEEYGGWHSSEALFPAVLSDEVVLFRVTVSLVAGSQIWESDISSSVVSESRELGCWWTVSLGILQQDFSQSFACL